MSALGEQEALFIVEVEPGREPGHAPRYVLADNVANGNKERGHIALVSADDEQPIRASFSFVDLGPVLHLWASTSAQIDTATARALGRELVEWADRKDGVA